MKKNTVIFFGAALVILGSVFFGYRMMDNFQPMPFTEFSQVREKQIKTTTTERLRTLLPDFYSIDANDMADEARNSLPGSALLAEDGSNVRLIDNAVNDIERLIVESDRGAELDDAVISILEDPGIPRRDKVQALWGLVLRIGIETEQGSYFLEYLQTLQPIELVPALIDAARTAQSPETRSQLMEIMASSLDIASNDRYSDSQLTVLGGHAEAVQEFLAAEMASTDNPDLFLKAIDTYTDIVPEAEAIEELQLLFTEDDTSRDWLQNPAVVQVLSRSALSSRDDQAALLPALIDRYGSSSGESESKTAFNRTLYSALETRGEDVSVIEEAALPALADYVATQEPPLLSTDEIGAVEVSDYFDWANAASSAASSEVDDRSSALADIAVNADDPVKAASIVLLGDESTLDAIRSSGRFEIIADSFEAASLDSSLPASTRQVFLDALSEMHDGTIGEDGQEQLADETKRD
jgi:hypothetical protein